MLYTAAPVEKWLDLGFSFRGSGNYADAAVSARPIFSIVRAAFLSLTFSRKCFYCLRMRGERGAKDVLDVSASAWIYCSVSQTSPLSVLLHVDSRVVLISEELPFPVRLTKMMPKRGRVMPLRCLPGQR